MTALSRSEENDLAESIAKHMRELFADFSLEDARQLLEHLDREGYLLSRRLFLRPEEGSSQLGKKQPLGGLLG